MDYAEAVAEVAHHEAGHAVVMLDAGWRVERVSIDPLTPDGLCLPDQPSLETVSDYRAALRVAVAGTVADAIRTGQDAAAMVDAMLATPAPPERVGDDRSEALALLPHAGCELAVAVGEADRVLRRDWALVERIVEAFQERAAMVPFGRPTISGDELVELLD